MKTPSMKNTERLNCKIRCDIKRALQALAAKRNRVEGGYVGLTRVINEAALLLLEREGISLEFDAWGRPNRKPMKSLIPRKASAEA